MSTAVANAARLKPELRLAQAVSRFEADLSREQKDALRSQRSQLQASSPDASDVIRLTSEIDKTSGIVAAVQQFASLGDVIIGGSQNIIACGVWMLVRTSLLVCSIATYSSYMDKLSTIFMDLGRSAPRHQAMALLYPQSKRLQADLTEYFVVVVDFCHQIWKFSQKSSINKFVSALGDSDLKTYQSKLESWAKSIKEEIQFLMAQQSLENGRNINGITSLFAKGLSFTSHQRDLQIKLRVLDLCSTYDHQTAWKQIRELGRCSNFAQSADYQEWRGGSRSSTLIYRGKLGSGKSVLLANIVEDVITHDSNPQRTKPLAYFFCKHDLPESLQARTIFGSLARQLLDFALNDTFLKPLPEETALSLDIEDTLELLRRAYAQTGAAYIVLDGLDECDFTTGEKIIQQLQTLQKCINLHLCLSFRLDPAENSSLNVKDLTAVKSISMPDNNPDIEAYIDGQLDHLVTSEKLQLQDPLLILEIQKKLMERSQGMFLWVALQLQSICTMEGDNNIRHALENLPKDLPETFNRILNRHRKDTKAFQRRILELVVVAFRPLTTEELREALSVIIGDVVWKPSNLLRNIISTLASFGGLILVDEEEKTVRLVHHSFKQYLIDLFQNKEEGRFSLDVAHGHMLDTIATYLSYNVFETRVSTAVVPRMNIGSAPAQIVRETLDSSVGQKIALKLLRLRKSPGFDISKTLAEAGSLYGTPAIDRFHFHDYAKTFYMQHIRSASSYQLAYPKLLAKLL
ncbi:hypothetical protein BT63DRAFT_354509, partial [Microthyrium microscopicum]